MAIKEEKERRDLPLILLLFGGGGLLLLTRKKTPVPLAQGTLNGTLLDDGGYTTRVSFEWGPTDTLGNVTNEIELPSGEPFEATIINLERQSPFYFRAKAVNEIETAYGEILSFTTPA